MQRDRLLSERSTALDTRELQGLVDLRLEPVRVREQAARERAILLRRMAEAEESAQVRACRFAVDRRPPKPA